MEVWYLLQGQYYSQHILEHVRIRKCYRLNYFASINTNKYVLLSYCSSCKHKKDYILSKWWNTVVCDEFSKSQYFIIQPGILSWCIPLLYIFRYCNNKYITQRFMH